jgi:NADP-dependent 3-hydroxy acid dehydrogenase YdfG
VVDERSLDGTGVIVTGASSGIGEATAERLAADGARVALVARREERLRALADRVDDGPGEAVVLPADLSDEDRAREVVREADAALDGLDVLVNNAGVMLLSPLVRADVADLRQMLEVNLLGLMAATREAVPLLLEAGGGHVVNVSSTAGRRATAGASGYNASKWGVNGFTEAVRQEVTAEGVRTTLIEPGAVDTELPEHIPDEGMRDAVDEMTSEMTPLRSEDVADAVHYAVTRPEHVSVNELLIRPTEQER